jgi:uncharacterized protein (TIGR00290 family)
MSGAHDLRGQERILLGWSSGKDSAWALHRLRQAGAGVAGLFTTIDEAAGEIGMHGAPAALARRQAEACGLPLTEIPLPWPCPNDVYEARMAAFADAARESGVTQVAFGDLYLEDIRRYREQQFEGSGLTPVFPLFGRDTRSLAEEMIAGGLVAHLVCIDKARMPARFLGRRFDEALLADLPEGVDPCGENGEFHTLVTDGPIFAAPVAVRFGSVRRRGGFARLELDAA